MPGVELTLQARPHRALALSGHYAFTAADLPGQPRHQAFGRIELERPRGDWRPAVFYEGDLASRAYLDLGRGRLMPGRLLHAAGVRLTLRRPGGEVRLSLEARNLADARVGTVPLAPAASAVAASGAKADSPSR